MSATSGAVHVMHHDPSEAVGRRERLGVRLLIVADASFVFATIFAYLYLRNLNTNGGWLPKGAHLATTSGWVTAIPFVIAALLHAYGRRNRSMHAAVSPLVFVVLVIGAYLQVKQLASMPFMLSDGSGFEGTYASSWFLLAMANMIHYVLGGFVALGLAVRARRVQLDAELDGWRLSTAGSWFTWIAIAACASAVTTMIVAI